MICPHCELDTSPTEETCQHCDGALNVIFEELDRSDRVRREERERDLAAYTARSWLLLAACVFAIALGARLALVREAPHHLVEPAYEPRLESSAPVVDLPLEPPLMDIPGG